MIYLIYVSQKQLNQNHKRADFYMGPYSCEEDAQRHKDFLLQDGGPDLYVCGFEYQIIDTKFGPKWLINGELLDSFDILEVEEDGSVQGCIQDFFFCGGNKI